MDKSKTALLLIGFQNDYFAENGILREVLQGNARQQTLQNLCIVLDAVADDSELLVISAPIQFTEDYSEITKPVGILQAIIDCGAFRIGQKGTETIPEIRKLGERVLEVPGRRGLNAFSNTDLEDVLIKKGISDVVLAGVVTSLCVDSTARSAFDRGYQVHVLSDTTAGRTDLEQEFYTTEVFPMYAEVIDHMTFLENLQLTSSKSG